MSAATKIEWTDRSWNPVRGCQLVSPGCRSCYAMKQAHRFSGKGKAYEGLTKLGANGPMWTGKVRTVPEALEEPLHWRKPARVFVNSMSDLFHEDVPDAFIAQVFAFMAVAFRHTFQTLTKRADRMQRLLSDSAFWLKVGEAITLAVAMSKVHGVHARIDLDRPLPNVWLGVSVEDQARADERIPHLLRTPAAVRFLSCEPLLEAVDLRGCGLSGQSGGIQWVIVGGESGPGARPMRLDWAQRIVDDCQAAGVAVFCKQLGAKPVEFLNPLKLNDRKGGDPSEWPQSLAVREFPEVR